MQFWSEGILLWSENTATKWNDRKRNCESANYQCYLCWPESVLMDAAVDVGDIQALETAFRALVIFKFSGVDDSNAFLGSPVMASAASRMLAAIREYWVAAGNRKRADEWRDLYVLSNAKRHKGLISLYLPSHSNWRNLSMREKIEWLEVIASPYCRNDEGVAMFDNVINVN
jgi:hypothetical protein